MNVHVLFLSWEHDQGIDIKGVFSNFDQAVKACERLRNKTQYFNCMWQIQEFTLNGNKLGEAVWSSYDVAWRHI